MDVKGLDVGVETGAAVRADARVGIETDTLGDGAEAKVCFEVEVELGATFKVQLDAESVGFESEPEMSAELSAGGVGRVAGPEKGAECCVAVDPELNVGIEVEAGVEADAGLGFEAVVEIVDFEIAVEAGGAETNARVVLEM